MCQVNPAVVYSALSHSGLLDQDECCTYLRCEAFCDSECMSPLFLKTSFKKDCPEIWALEDMKNWFEKEEKKIANPTCTKLNDEPRLSTSRTVSSASTNTKAFDEPRPSTSRSTQDSPSSAAIDNFAVDVPSGFTVLEDSTRRYDRLNMVGKVIDVLFPRVTPGENTVEVTLQRLEDLVNSVVRECRPSDYVGMEIWSHARPAARIEVPLRRADKFKPAAVIDTIKAEGQSKQAMLLDGGIMVKMHYIPTIANRKVVLWTTCMPCSTCSPKILEFLKVYKIDKLEIKFSMGHCHDHKKTNDELRNLIRVNRVEINVLNEDDRKHIEENKSSYRRKADKYWLEVFNSIRNNEKLLPIDYVWNKLHPYSV